ncbi:MAG TPA: type II secretion system protein [Telluria sp.]|nr:type II secretion system protein [Telluria sp.]
MNIHRIVSRIDNGAQRGVALPVMLIVLAIMLISGAYLLKSSNSSTLTAANLAYQSTLNRAADRALMEGSEWLAATWTNNRAALINNNEAAGYVATLDTTQSVRTPAFWIGKKTITDSNDVTIDYVIHRLCSRAMSYDDPVNQCMQTTANTAMLGTTVAIGGTLAQTGVQLAGNPQLHYIITARIYGPRGGNVVSQLAVLMGV